MPATKVDNLHFLRGAILVVAGHDADYLSTKLPGEQKRLDALAEATLRNFKPIEVHTLGEAPGWVSAVRKAAKQLHIKCYPLPTLLSFMDLIQSIDVVFVLWDGEAGANLKEIVRRAKLHTRPVVNVWPLWEGSTDVFEGV